MSYLRHSGFKIAQYESQPYENAQKVNKRTALKQLIK